MSGSLKKLRSKSTFAPYIVLCTSLMLVVVVGAWGAVRDLRLVRSTLSNAEIVSLRAQATRRAGHLEAALATNSQGDAIDWARARESGWLSNYWESVGRHQKGQIYAAVVDLNGRIVAHTNPAVENRDLGSHWYDRAITEAGRDVVETRDALFTGGAAAYDIQVPLYIASRKIGTYHEGISVDWVERQSGAFRQQIIWRWSVVIGGFLLVVGLSLLSLLSIVRRKAEIQRLADLAEVRRVTEVGQLAAGLAHEIRNPLQAIRLNVHAFGKVLRGQAELDDEEITRMVEQSSKEIERVDHLMTELLGFASPQEARDTKIDLRHELEATLDFIEQELMHKKLKVTTDFPAIPVYVQMDPARFRQVVLNLLVNAQDAVEDGGHIRVGLQWRAGRAEVTVADDGPGVGEAERQHIFEPFYSTKEDGTGLGLALVKRFIEEADGEVDCTTNGNGAVGAAGTTFRVSLPLSPEGKHKRHG